MIQNWADEVRRHVNTDGVSVLIYHGAERYKISLQDLPTKAIVITTYDTLARDAPLDITNAKPDKVFWTWA